MLIRFTEQVNPHFTTSMRVTNVFASTKSMFQKVDVMETSKLPAYIASHCTHQ